MNHEATVQVFLFDGVRLVVGDVDVLLRGEREQALLARLALDAGTEVHRSVLIDDVWGSAADTVSSSALRVQVKRLRRHLEPIGAGHELETTAGGYRLSPNVHVDVHHAREVTAEATPRIASDPAHALSMLDALGDLSAVQPLRGLEDLQFAAMASQRLTNLALHATTLRARINLELGRPQVAASLIAAISHRVPTDEGVAAMHIDALIAMGKNRDALAVAHRLRTDLSEVGLVPGEEILQRERQILNPVPELLEPSTTGLIGRHVECRRLMACVDALHDEVGGTATISGPAGIGKTALAQVVIDEALARGWTAYSATTDEIDRHRPFHLLHSLHRHSPSDGPEPVDLSHWLSEIPLPGAPGAFDPDSARMTVARHLQSALAVHASPAVVVAEDLHWADDSSLALLRSLTRAARHYPVFVVLTGRPTTDWHRALGDLPRIDIALGPLDDTSTRLLAEARVGGSLGPDLTNAIASTGGNPMLVIEYLRGLELEARLVRVGSVVDCAGTGPPMTVRQTVARRWRSLPAELVAVLEAAAVLGRSSPVNTLSRLADVDPDHLVILLDIAAERCIASCDGRSVTYIHDLVRDAIYENIEAGRRARLHRAAAQLFAAEGRPAISIAAHAILSSPDGDAQSIVWMRAAAAEACAVEPRSSITFIDRALTLTRDIDDRFSLQHAKLEALTTAGELKEATELVDLLVRAGRPETAALQVRYAGLMMAQANAREARRILSGVDEELLMPELRPRCTALRALCSYADFDQPQALSLAHEAVEQGLQANDPIGLSMAHGVVGRCNLMAHHYREGLRAGRLSAEYADADPTGGAHLYLPWYFVGMTLLDLDDHLGVENALARGRTGANEHHLHFSEPLYLTLEAALAQRTGDLRRLQRTGTEVLAIERQLGYGLVSAWVRALLSLGALESGDLDLAAIYCEQAEHAQMAGSPQGSHVVALARAEVHRSSGDLTAAHHGLRKAWHFFDAFSLHACKPFIASAFARAATHVGDSASCDELRDEMAVLTSRSDGIVHGALAKWVRGLVDRDRSALVEASEILEASGRVSDARICRGDVMAIGH